MHGTSHIQDNDLFCSGRACCCKKILLVVILHVFTQRHGGIDLMMKHNFVLEEMVETTTPWHSNVGRDSSVAFLLECVVLEHGVLFKETWPITT